VVAVPALFDNTASYSLPFCDVLTPDKTSVGEVAPEIGCHVLPPSRETRHCSAGAGLPDATVVNDAAWPAVRFVFAGCVVMLGATTTGPDVRFAPLLAAIVGLGDFFKTSAAATPRTASANTMTAIVRADP
jgi:hypothetical protein